VAAALVVVAGALGAPATVASAAAQGSRCPPDAESAVVQAYANLFSRAVQLTADERAASLARGDDPAVRAILDRWLATPEPSTTSIAVSGIRCPTKRTAVVHADLVLAGVPLPEVLRRGRAVREDGTWKVATSTFCRRMVLENPALAGSCP
jgi:hypothetical protein